MTLRGYSGDRPSFVIAEIYSLATDTDFLPIDSLILFTIKKGIELKNSIPHTLYLFMFKKI